MNKRAITYTQLPGLRIGIVSSKWIIKRCFECLSEWKRTTQTNWIVQWHKWIGKKSKWFYFCVASVDFDIYSIQFYNLFDEDWFFIGLRFRNWIQSSVRVGAIVDRTKKIKKKKITTTKRCVCWPSARIKSEIVLWLNFDIGLLPVADPRKDKWETFNECFDDGKQKKKISEIEFETICAGRIESRGETRRVTLVINTGQSQSNSWIDERQTTERKKKKKISKQMHHHHRQHNARIQFTSLLLSFCAVCDDNKHLVGTTDGPWPVSMGIQWQAARHDDMSCESIGRHRFGRAIGYRSRAVPSHCQINDSVQWTVSVRKWIAEKCLATIASVGRIADRFV